MTTKMATQEFLDDMVNSGAYAEYAREAHETWRSTKAGQGWTFGPRDNAKKTNPLMLPFDELAADVKGQNSLTPYAVVNYFRVNSAALDPRDLEKTLGELGSGKRPELLDSVGEYVHSHFMAAQLAKGETVKSRDDMIVYEKLTDAQKSWDLESAKKVALYLRDRLTEYMKK